MLELGLHQTLSRRFCGAARFAVCAGASYDTYLVLFLAFLRRSEGLVMFDHGSIAAAALFLQNLNDVAPRQQKGIGMILIWKPLPVNTGR